MTEQEIIEALQGYCASLEAQLMISLPKHPQFPHDWRNSDWLINLAREASHITTDAEGRAWPAAHMQEKPQCNTSTS